jgi:hypothetical protein
MRLGIWKKRARAGLLGLGLAVLVGAPLVAQVGPGVIAQFRVESRGVVNGVPLILTHRDDTLAPAAAPPLDTLIIIIDFGPICDPDEDDCDAAEYDYERFAQGDKLHWQGQAIAELPDPSDSTAFDTTVIGTDLSFEATEAIVEPGQESFFEQSVGFTQLWRASSDGAQATGKVQLEVSAALEISLDSEEEADAEFAYSFDVPGKVVQTSGQRDSFVVPGRSTSASGHARLNEDGSFEVEGDLQAVDFQVLESGTGAPLYRLVVGHSVELPVAAKPGQLRVVSEVFTGNSWQGGSAPSELSGAADVLANPSIRYRIVPGDGSRFEAVSAPELSTAP